MTTGTLEQPIEPWWSNTKYHPVKYHPVKCPRPGCNSKSFALYVPENWDTYYESCEIGQERNDLIPKLFKGLSDSGEYYCWVKLSCAKCGEELEDVGLYMSLDNWKPPQERKPPQNKT